MELLKQLSQASGASGSENEVSENILEMLRTYTQDISVDSMGNIRAMIKKPEEGQKLLLFQAHMDEVGLIVTSLEKGGFLHVSNCGGLDIRILPAMEVCIHGKKDLPGVVCSIPPHLKDISKGGSSIEDVLVDTGLSDEEMEELIHPGDFITFVSPPASLYENCLTGKALDNRAGVASVLLALEALRGKKIPCGLMVLFSVQEEVGCRGAGPGAFDAKVDSAICVDVSFGASCDLNSPRYGVLGSGPMLGYSPILDKKMGDTLMYLAMKNNIPYQTEVMGGNTSTDADVIAIVQQGVKTALLSVPLRYMHTPVEVVDTEDVKLTAQLLAAFAMANKEEE